MKPDDHDSTRQLMDLTPSLVESLREGNREAAPLLDHLYRSALIRFCWGYLGRLQDAEDAVQEICFKVLQAKDVPDYFRPWLYRVARNHCLNILRKHKRDVAHGDLPSESKMQDVATGQLTHLIRAEDRSGVRRLTEKLSEQQQEVLRLRYVEDLSRSEIAEVLEIEESVVKSRLFEGLKALREHALSAHDS